MIALDVCHRRGCEHLVAQADIANGFQLPEVPYKDHGQVPEGVVVGIAGRITEVLAICLLQTEMHAREEVTSDKRGLVKDDQYVVPPFVLELLKRITGELIFPRRISS